MTKAKKKTKGKVVAMVGYGFNRESPKVQREFMMVLRELVKRARLPAKH